jgi:hypothetical protein
LGTEVDFFRSYPLSFVLDEQVWALKLINGIDILRVMISVGNKSENSLAVPKSPKSRKRLRGTNQKTAWLCPKVPNPRKNHGEETRKTRRCAQKPQNQQEIRRKPTDN